jgi:hypothetical protein
MALQANPFFASGAGVLQPTEAAPPRVTLAQQRPVFAMGGHQLAAMAMTVVLCVPYAAASTSTYQPIMNRTAERRNKVMSPRKPNADALDDQRVQMKPKTVLAFRRVVRPTAATVRLRLLDHDLDE